MAGPVAGTERDPKTNKRVAYRIGKAEILQVWPLLVYAILLIAIVYGINIYESLFQLPQLAPVK